MLLWAVNAAELFLYPSPDLYLDTILSRRSTDNSLDFMAWFVLWDALLTVGPYIDRRVPFQIMSNQLSLPQVDSGQVIETSQWWSEETRSILSVMAKAVNTYVHVFSYVFRYGGNL